MSKFKVTMQFMVNNDELGTRFKALISGYNGEVVSIEPIEETPKLEQAHIPTLPVNTVREVRLSKRQVNMRRYDPCRMIDVYKIIHKHFRLGDTMTRIEWTRRVLEIANKNWNENSVYSHFTKLRQFGIFTNQTRHSGIMYAKSISFGDLEMQYKKQNSVTNANKRGLEIYNETR